MTGMPAEQGDSLLAALRDAAVVAADDHSITRFEPFVSIPVETRDGLVAEIERLREIEARYNRNRATPAEAEAAREFTRHGR